MGPWRAPAVNTNTFARESHVDTYVATLARSRWTALFDATGARLTDLPLTPPRVRAAIAASAGRKGEPESVHLPRIAASRRAAGPLFVK